MHNTTRSLALLGAGLGVGAPCLAAGVPGLLEEVQITARRPGDLIGSASSASVGTVTAEQLENRPILRTGEILEVVTGLVVTQHSGDGKANQYVLRGFNLDHGTDFATRVEGMPVNMPTHAHGQGYTDINFMIPELVERVEYKKGTYYADEGNFSAAGSVDVIYKRAQEQKLALVSGGAHDFLRSLLVASPQVAGGDLLLAADASYYDGPWSLASHFRKLNGVAKFTRGDAERGFGVDVMGYDGRWRSTDQIPQRAVASGDLGRFGYVDPTDGGDTHRYSVSLNGWTDAGPGRLRALIYGVDYGLDLFSNFTYALNDVEGDQFEQVDDRTIGGADLRYTQPLASLGRAGTLSAGAQLRRDDIAPLGLYLTDDRLRHDTVRRDEVKQTSYSAYLSQETHWTSWLRSGVGVRFDQFEFDVASSLSANSGSASDNVTSPKLTLAFGPWVDTEVFLNWGRGFHSNDARGATISVDPADGVSPAERVTPLVTATGSEIGVRTAVIPHVQLAASVWTLQLDSELLFVGDGGSTEPSRASRRTGFELGVYYTPIDALIIDADFAVTRPRFTADDAAGDRIPNAVESVISLGAEYHSDTGFFGGARLRYLGAGALIEDNSVRSQSSTLLNLEAGYHLSRNIRATAMLFNALDENANDITYYYESRLPNEAAPVEDLHFHPAEPRQLRVQIEARF